uniref:RNA helicase n=1 Tax=Tetranychus urticae TaxID=32264 RepID=T1JS66_TETUR
MLLLPIKDHRVNILKKIKENQIIFLKSETGSGKTTQVPQWCLESRRLATIAVANRVAQERGVELGQEVGYCVRFDHCYSRKTQLFYKTEGILVREAITDPLFMKYSIILADEAHRRTKILTFFQAF